jgi:CTP:molybdopterin cytidylyltransferase MocA
MSTKHESGDLMDGVKGIRTLLMDGKLLLMEVGPQDAVLTVDLNDPDQAKELAAWLDCLRVMVQQTFYP